MDAALKINFVLDVLFAKDALHVPGPLSGDAAPGVFLKSQASPDNGDSIKDLLGRSISEQLQHIDVAHLAFEFPLQDALAWQPMGQRGEPFTRGRRKRTRRASFNVNVRVTASLRRLLGHGGRIPRRAALFSTGSSLSG
jgi:hypothetical protein